MNTEDSEFERLEHEALLRASHFDRIPPFTQANPQSDFGLSAEQLRDKYDPDGGDGHPQHTRADWRKAVAEEAVISGYWVWVWHSIKEK